MTLMGYGSNKLQFKPKIREFKILETNIIKKNQETKNY